MTDMFCTLLIYTVVGLVALTIAGVACLCGYSLSTKEENHGEA